MTGEPEPVNSTAATLRGMRIVVLDDEQLTAHIFTSDRTQVLGPDEALTLPEILPGFSVAVRRFLE